MTTISSDVLALLNGTSSTSSSSSSTSSSSTDSSSTTLGSDTFLKLLVTQMQNQNPLDPQDNTEFVSQLAQFSSLEGITSLNTTLSSLATSLQSSQAVQASALVGQQVQIESSTANLTSGGNVSGIVDLTSSTTDLTMKIYDSSNTLVYSADLGSQSAGEVPFVWDGTDSSGNTVAAGTYKFVATANDSGKSTALTTYLSANVDSVTLGSDKSVTLNVDTGAQVSLSDVKNFL